MSDAVEHPVFTPVAGARLADRYELISLIATGGMAQVWRATDTVLGRSVAAKILHPHLATDRGFLVRFRREAVAAARLSHPGIVSIYDTVSQPGLEAIVMELVDGDTLRSILDQRGALPPDEVIDLGLQITDALANAHASGIVHRDIKPSNILRCRDNRVRVTDFGIAKAGEDTDLTVTGTLLGTAKYLSPEQVRGDASDPRSDLYSVGIVLFEALTGRPPFRADTDAATALARLQKPPPRTRHINPELPQDLDDLVASLMARDPDDRPDRAGDLRVALSALRPRTEVPGPVDETLVVAEPVYVPPDLADEEEAIEDEIDEFIASERSWMLPAMVLVLTATALIVVGALFSRTPLADTVLDRTATTDAFSDPAGNTADTVTITPIDVVVEPSTVSATPIDPGGDGAERNETAAFAIDDNNDTYWRTERYRSPNFGNLKPGVGLVIDLGGPARVREITLDTRSKGWSVELFLGDDFTGSRATWGDPVATGSNLEDDVDFDIDELVGRQLLVWITDPGTSQDGTDDDEEPDHRFELTEVEVR
jgi:serine/threonine-protein kinase